MPRKRQTAIGNNRTDQTLPNPATVPVATGQPYGAHQAQVAQAAAIPPMPGAQPGAQPGPVVQPPTWDQAAQAARATPFQSLGLVSGDSIRPHEPVTTGIPYGPGANALTGPPMGAPSSPVRSVADTLADLAVIEPSLASLANLARGQGV